MRKLTKRELEAFRAGVREGVRQLELVRALRSYNSAHAKIRRIAAGVARTIRKTPRNRARYAELRRRIAAQGLALPSKRQLRRIVESTFRT